MKYITKGTCSREIEFEVDGNVIQSVKFVGGCAGNTAGVASLIQGMDIHEAISRIKGIDCKGRGTSCPDQLALALEKYLREQEA